MTRKPQDNQQKDDAVVSASKQSKVTSEKKSSWITDKFTWIIGGVVLFVLFAMFFSGGHKKKEGDSSNTAKVQQDYNTELAENLAHLRKMNQEIKQQARQLSGLDTSGQNSRQYLARQNAPTSMYSGSVTDNTSPANASRNGTTQATFAGQGVYTDFGNQATVATSVSAQKIAHPRYTIAGGEFMHAVLETAVDSDLPGQIRAVVSQPVYAYVGNQSLIPAGSRLIGQYSSSVFQGQDRVFVVWNRVILPNGITAQLNSPGVDDIGQAGQGADSVNRHFFARFGEAALLSIIGAGVANAGVSTNDQYNSAAQYRMAMAQSFQQSANDSLQNTLPTKPTLRIFQGAAINVFVAHDIDFHSVLANQNNDGSSLITQYGVSR